jgi:ribonuclease P protein component
VAFAVPRATGNAVVRNRLRRRLRAAIRELEPELVPGGSYLVGAGRPAVTMTPTELRDELAAVLRRAREQAPR